jgi:fermentation-respiration switch protein FrsA (DUF1100 family)
MTQTSEFYKNSEVYLNKYMKKRLLYIFNLLAYFLSAIFIVGGLPTLYVCDRSARAYLHPAKIPPSGQWLQQNNIPYQNIELTTKDGVTLSAWYTPPKNGKVILLAHGLSGNRPEGFHAMFAQNGYGVVSWDFRAHGISGGGFSTLGYYERLDVESALDYALTQPDVEHVGAWGASLGAATIILAAAQRPEIEAVAADSSFPTLEDAMRVSIPLKFMEPMVISLYEFHSGIRVDDVRPVDVIAQISPRAVFIMDGWQGGAILMNSPNRLYDAAKQPKEIWVEKGVPHLGMYGFNPALYEQKVIAFFEKYLR